MKFFLRLARRLRDLREDRRRERWSRRFRERIRAFQRPYKLHLGSGSVRLRGWVHIDRAAVCETVDVQWDLLDPVPLDDGSCALIYSEHVLEHFSQQDGARLLRECHRLLAGGGIVRCAMPSLDELICKANSGKWREQDWLSWPEYSHIETRAEMLNVAFRSWGHKWLYDREELHRRLREAGFPSVEDVKPGESATLDLQGLETRRDSLLICEATK